MKLGDLIKQYRETENLTMQEFADRAELSKGYVSMLEKGKHPQSKRKLVPSLETYQKIATAMNMSLDELINAVDDNSVVSLGSPAPEAVDDCPASAIYNSLNKAGQAEYIRYGRYLTSQDEFRALNAEPQIEYIRHYLTAAAAGYAAPIEGEDYELIPKDGSVPALADFSIDITGDSMEPYIHDGQRVYVQRGSDKMQEFDVGIFYVDGDVFCKQWCIDYNRTLMLLSANPAREDANIYVERDSDRDVICFGKVLIGKLPKPSYM